MSAYWVAMMDVTDTEGYKAYPAAAAKAVEKFGGRVIAVGPPVEVLEGKSPRSRYAVLEFESTEKASACYHSPEYQEAFALRKDASDADFVIVNGT